MTVPAGLTHGQRAAKRALDLTVAVPLLAAAAPVIALLWVVSAVVHRAGGFYRQERIGWGGEPFSFIKLRSMHPGHGDPSTVTTSTDARLSRFGAWLRRWKLDELPQLWHVVTGQMSLVGPRPDVAGYADELRGADRVVVGVRPGVTGLATAMFRDEERLLASVDDPERFNDEVLYPAKVALNRHYVESWSLLGDLRLLVLTVLGRRLPMPADVRSDHPRAAALVTPPTEEPPWR